MAVKIVPKFDLTLSEGTAAGELVEKDNLHAVQLTMSPSKQTMSATDVRRLQDAITGLHSLVAAYTQLTDIENQ